jgi:putative membrane protein insertion efficiency factor/ribonuclease P protein component
VTIETLRRSADFRRVSAQGKTTRLGGLRLQWLRNNTDRNRYGVAATTATGGAVVRNRIRRWSRELLRRWDGQLAQGFDIVVLASVEIPRRVSSSSPSPCLPASSAAGLRRAVLSGEDGPSRLAALPALPAIGLLKFYRRFISPYSPPSCRFTPTCSRYAIDALRRYGLLRGGWLAIWRILRCNPFTRGGYDPLL